MTERQVVVVTASIFLALGFTLGHKTDDELKACPEPSEGDKSVVAIPYEDAPLREFFLGDNG